MNRRFFLLSAIAGIATSSSLFAANAESLDYEPGLLKQKLAEGDTVLLDFAADWCSTCKRQERVISQLRSENPLFDQHITFIRVDWDQYGNSDIATSYNIPRRSTLLLLKDDKELGRIIAGTQSAEIQALLEKALPA